MQMKTMLWNVEWHDVPNRRMAEGWFLAATADDAVTAAKSTTPYGAVHHRMNSLNGSVIAPVDPDSFEGQKIAPRIGMPTKGHAAVRYRGNRM